MDYLIKKLYGRKKEKTSEINGQLPIGELAVELFNEAYVIFSYINHILY